MKITTYLTVTDENGVQLSRKRSHSFIQGFALFLACNLGRYQTVATYKDTSNAAQVAGYIHGTTTALGANGVNADGLQAGRIADSVAINSYAMTTLIANGVGANQLQYGPGSITDPVTAGNSCSFTYSRTLTNGSGSAIDVVAVGWVYHDVSGHTFMFEKTMQATNIPNGEARTFTYTVTIMV